MVARNHDIAQLKTDYLFMTIAEKKQQLLQKHPDALLINLGIGDTTEPLAPPITEALIQKAKELGSAKGYSGYGNALGDPLLRKKIAETLYNGTISANDLFISDGAKCDIGRLQILFGRECSIAVQDPAYPAYIAASALAGKVKQHLLPCTPSNNFLPDLSNLPTADLLYICSPNNPTGAVLTHEQLETLVSVAKARGSIILFDSAYAGFIRDPSLPRSIYEIKGAEEVAIETGSFSKLAGFTGVRLGWTVVPEALLFSDGSSVRNDWIQVISTFFNGASNLAQAGGLAVLTQEGLKASRKICDHYLENATLLREAVEKRGLHCFGGENAPYLWVELQGENSWEAFDRLLHENHLVTTPGAGFGPSGEGFLRLSAFGQREHILEACKRFLKS